MYSFMSFNKCIFAFNPYLIKIQDIYAILECSLKLTS